jgi:hypothetical protein
MKLHDKFIAGINLLGISEEEIKNGNIAEVKNLLLLLMDLLLMKIITIYVFQKRIF